MLSAILLFPFLFLQINFYIYHREGNLFFQEIFIPLQIDVDMLVILTRSNIGWRGIRGATEP
jgi:hypothetical protein